ncbi:MAG: AAA family ATPase [Cyclobacteriaceae bacterium]|nr:AAA family ATPase [Cyclobacteriaceae bacterium]
MTQITDNVADSDDIRHKIPVLQMLLLTGYSGTLYLPEIVKFSNTMIHTLTVQDLRSVCDTIEVKRLFPDESQFRVKIIGQERGVKALKLGIGIKARGFNVYVSGRHGTGKLTAVKGFVEEPARTESIPPDWCYVNNFKDLYQPKRLSLPAGMGTQFKNDLKNLIADSRQTLIKAFESEDYIKRRKKIVDALEQQQEELLLAVKQRAFKDHIQIEETPVDIITVPLHNGKPMTNEEFSNLDENEQKKIRKKQAQYFDEIKTALREGRKIEKTANENVSRLQKEVAKFAVEALFEETEEKYIALPEALKHLKDVQEDMLNNLGELLGSDKPAGALFFSKKYEVNLLVNNAELQGAPVVLELHPTYYNLFGRVEKEVQMGTWITDMSLIRKGALHAANGGYLIIPVEELFKNPFSWESLKRALKNKEIAIEDLSEQWGFITAKTLKPESIPLNVKVILIGNPLYYHVLYQYDNDFRELFKVKADFDTSMPRTETNISQFIGFCLTLTRTEQLLPMTSEALSRIIEFGSRLADNKEKLSTQFGEIADVIREANHYASLERHQQIDASHIQKAVEEKIYRSNLIQEKINEMIQNKQILIDIEGKKIGQVNGLSVILLGDIEFGIPNRITCSTSLGKDGIIAIEREAEMSGPIHTKGVMILTGYLSEQFIQDKPISLNAHLVFEQSYSEIEGDSASSTELYAILSRLADVPIQQGIAVTGSVNQKGEVQAIGGVNEKIEGYFEVCKKIGLTGEQGVIIPSSNMRNLMLKEEVCEAVRKGNFKIWAIDLVHEGIELLTGMKAETKDEPGTIACLVNQKLNAYADKLKAYANEDASDNHSSATR